MSVSFQGFKNAGVQSLKFYNRTGEIGRATIFNCEVTNDAGRDLDAFQRLFKKMAHPVNNKFLNVQVLERKKGDDEFYKTSVFHINGQECNVNTETLWIFGTIARFLRKICETQNEKFIVNEDYIEGDDVIDSFVCLDKGISREVLDIMHSPQNVKEDAQNIIESMTNAVDCYLSD